MSEVQTTQPSDEGVPSPFPPEVTHSHDNGRTAVHVVTHVCPHCSTSQAFTVPDDYDDRVRIVVVCRQCGKHSQTPGKDPGDVLMTGVLPTITCGHCGKPQTVTSTEFACTECGQVNRLIVATDSGQGTSAASTV